MLTRVNGLAIGLLFWLMAAVAMTAPPPISLPPTVKGDVGSFVAIRAETTGKRVEYVPLDKGLNFFPSDLLPDPKATVVTAPKAGKYRVLAYTGNEDGPSKPSMTTVEIGSDDPTPQPQPQPPPKPDPSSRTNPFQDDAARVLIVWDPFGDKLTAGQYSAMYGDESWKSMKAFTGEGGFRIFPKGQESTDPVLSSALKRPMASYPWLMVGKGSVGSEGKLESLESIKSAISKVQPSSWTVGGTTFQICTPIYDSRGRLIGQSCPNP